MAYHVACHQRVQNIGARTREFLGLVPGTEVTAIERCSGHDGTYAIKAETYEKAMKIARPVVKRVREAEPGIILHLAGVNHGTLEELLAGNVIATRNLPDATCAMGEPPRVLVTGSSAEYGFAGTGPIPESAPLSPVSPYAVSKVAADLLARSYALARELRLESG